jgi:hypothetical protein
LLIVGASMGSRDMRAHRPDMDAEVRLFRFVLPASGALRGYALNAPPLLEGLAKTIS